MIRMRVVIIGLVAAPALLSIVCGSLTAVAADLPIISLSCVHDPGDEILDLICQRVEREARPAAMRAGYRLVLPATDPVGDGERSLVIELTANTPDSRFGDKRIQALKSGRRGTGPDAVRESRLDAQGVPRDKVHPVADAELGQEEEFLASSD